MRLPPPADAMFAQNAAIAPEDLLKCTMKYAMVDVKR
jgi:hypothetical protein